MSVFCFGEILLRLSPVLDRQWLREAAMPVYIGGAELNVATALANWNVPAKYSTALPDNYFSQEIVAELQSRKIDTSAIHFSGDKIGIYYLPQGGDLKSAGVIYDRNNSSFANLLPGMIHWDEVLKDCTWFHFSAISPALNENAAAVCKEALEAAAAKGLTISVDLNYRSILWQYGKKPTAVMPELVQHCDVVMGNIWAADTLLDISVAANLVREKQHLIHQAQATSEAIIHCFPKCRQVANTFRFEETDRIHYYATLYADRQLFVSGEHKTGSVVDRVGSGDAFMAGLIYGNRHRWEPQETIRFAAAAAFDKLFIRGDATTSPVEKIKKNYPDHA